MNNITLNAPVVPLKAHEFQATHPMQPNFYLKAGLTEAQKKILPRVNQIAENIYQGAYPGSKDPLQTEKMQSVLIKELGITHIVCLIDKKQLKQFADYKVEIEGVKRPEWIQFEIIDQRTAKDDQVNAFTDKLVELVKNKNNKVFIHCWGGNGRTNTISSILLSKLNGWKWEQSLFHLFKCYLTRKEPTTDRLPETKEQFEQVRRLCGGSEIDFEDWKMVCRRIKSNLRPDLAQKRQPILQRLPDGRVLIRF